MAGKFGDSINRTDPDINAMPPNSSKSPAPAPAPAAEEIKARTGRRLILAAALIGLAIGGLALVDRFRERPTGLAPPHEPSLALITTPVQESEVPAARLGQVAIPPPPPQVVNNETLATPPRTASAPPSPATQSAPAQNNAPVPGKAYLVQVGVFASPANAQALQRQLRRAGIDAHLETRVQLGPFKDKRDADKALARARKLGVNAVLVGGR